MPPVLGDVILAALVAAASVLARTALDAPLGVRQPFITTFPGLLILGLFRGTRAAAIYIVLVGLAHTYMFVPERYSMRIWSGVDVAVVLSYSMISLMLLGVVHAQRLSQRRLAMESEERRAAEAHIRRLNAELEDRVRERTSQLEEANRELEAFSYSVSHDLRAPLRHIAGFSDMLIKRIGGPDGPLDDTSRRYISVITDAVARAGSLVDDLLAFSRMGRAELMETRVDTAGLVQEIVREFESDTRERGIEWTIGPLPDIHADPSMLRLVWRNLISNAVKYSRHAKAAVIEIGIDSEAPEAGRAESTEAGIDPDPGESHPVVFFVRDNGVGFDMKYADKLFGVFQRLHRTDEFEGIGIGLANVRRIIQRHGGRAWAQATPGQGATFYFSLPAHREKLQPAHRETIQEETKERLEM